MTNRSKLNCSVAIKPVYYLSKVFNLHLIPLECEQCGFYFHSVNIIFFTVYTVMIFGAIYCATYNDVLFNRGEIVINSVDGVCSWFSFVVYIIIIMYGRINRKRLISVIKCINLLQIPDEIFEEERKFNIRKIILASLTYILSHFTDYYIYTWFDPLNAFINIICYAIIEIFMISATITVTVYASLCKRIFVYLNKSMLNIKYFNELTNLYEMHNEVQKLFIIMFKTVSMQILLLVLLKFVSLVTIIGYVNIKIKNDRSPRN